MIFHFLFSIASAALRSYSTFLASADDTPPPAAQRTASLAARFLMRLGQRSEVRNGNFFGANF